MIWLEPKEFSKQKYTVLRLLAPRNEKILLDFNPLRISDEPNWNPKWEEWHCYATPLTIYKQDYELLLGYFNKIYPIKDAFSGESEPVFDVCFDNWIGKDDWNRIISVIEQDFESVSEDKKPFITAFLDWVKEALNHTSIIVVEGNQ